MSSIYDDPAFFQAYAEMDRSKDGLEAAGEWRQLQPLFPDLRGKSVLDLGCGYGWHCRYAVKMGASQVVGIDCSERMLQRAMAENQDARITYERCDVEAYAYPESTYDLVVSNLVLHYIKDLGSVYQNVRRTLKTGGHFLFNMEHPTFTAGVHEDWIYDENGQIRYWAIDDYYYPGDRETRFLGHRVMKQHHTLTQILNPLLKIGFALEAVEEATPDADMMRIAGMQDEMRRPMMLLVKARKV